MPATEADDVDGQRRVQRGLVRERRLRTPPAPSAPRGGRHGFVTGAVCTFLVLVGLSVYAAVHQGVDTIDFSHGTVHFQGVTEAQVAEQQATVRAGVSQFQSSARADAVTTPSVADVSGQWRSRDSGLTYVITQYGNQAVVQAMSSDGITAAGQVEVSVPGAAFGYRAFNGDRQHGDAADRQGRGGRDVRQQHGADDPDAPDSSTTAG